MTIPLPDPHGRSAAGMRARIVSLGMALGGFFAITYVLCVLFDLWLPNYAMNQVWSPLLPGFVWLDWQSFLLGLVETFAYGWYVALAYVPLRSFFTARSA